MTWEISPKGIVKVDSVTEGLLTELAREEAALFWTQLEFEQAEANFEVASRKYAAVRDMVTAHLGYSPYIRPEEQWPSSAIDKRGSIPFGDNKFIHMRPGDAVAAVLKETQEPLTLEEIVDRLRHGGIGMKETVLTRRVNAALMRTKGIEKTEDGKYRYEEPESEELPF